MSQEAHPAASVDNEKSDGIYQVDRESSADSRSDIDLMSYHEVNAGRLIVDPECVPLPLSTVDVALTSFVLTFVAML